MKGKMAKRFLSGLLILAMTASLCGTTVMAAEMAGGEVPKATEQETKEGILQNEEGKDAAETGTVASDTVQTDTKSDADVSKTEDVRDPGKTEIDGTTGTAGTVADPAAGESDSAAASTETDENTEEEGIEALAEGVEDQEVALAEGELQDGVNVLKEGAEGQSFVIDDGKVLMIEGTDAEPIVFKNCTFDFSGLTVKISGNQGVSYHNGETAAKLWIGKNVQFDQCTFLTKSGGKSTNNGWDACIYFFSGEIVLNDCTLSGENYQGQFLGLYGSSGSVTFNRSNISTTGNTGGWSYAMYSASVLNLNDSTMSATGMKRAVGGGNVNAFYSGDLRTNYDAINIKNSTVDFSDNYSGGFAINNVNIHVTDSVIRVNDNAGNACNSGYWIVDNSSITINGNRGGHGLSCIGIEMRDSELEIEHNGYAGMYIQSKPSSFINSTVNIRCNGEKLASYSAGDVWLNSQTATFTDCESVWLGGVSTTKASATGSFINNGCKTFVAYDITNVKGRQAVIADGTKIDEQDKHTLFLNPDLAYAYARGISGANQDADLLDALGEEKVFGKDKAKIGELTTAQLSHHIYDWTKPELVRQASEAYYGAEKYECIDTCFEHKNWTVSHENSFDCEGTYVYAPLVGLAFDANAGDDTVTGMPEDQVEITYGEASAAPTAVPVRESGSDQYTYRFAGWYTDAACTKAFNFEEGLTENWTVVYAKWNKDYQPGLAPEGSEVNITKKASELNAEDETTVTLTVGSTEEKNRAAVLFVLDYSTSVNVRDAAADLIAELAAKDKTDIKCAVVNYWAEADEGTWTQVTNQTDVDALLSATKTGGTNYHAGLLSAQKLLASPEIEGYSTYLITISDGITYLWTDEVSGDTLSVWYQTGANGEDANIQNGNSVYEMKYAVGTAIPEDVFASLTAGDEAAAEKYENTKDYFRPYKENGHGGKYLSFKNADTADKYLIGNEIAIYKTAELYKELADSVDHAYAFKLDENHWNSYPYGEQLMDYLASVSNGGAITANTAKSTFDSIKNQILYAIQKGTVTDVIGEDFDLKAVNTFRLKVGETELPGTVDGTNKNLIHFGEADHAGVYPYSVEYQPGEAGAEQFVWNINVPVEEADGLSLSYVLKLVQKSEVPGTYGIYDEDGSEKYADIQTNVSAVLNFETTDGDTGSLVYPKPTVSYTVLDSVTVKKVWKLDNGGKATDSVEAQLLKDGQVYAKVTLNAANNWTYTWTDLDAKAIWTVKETQVPEGFTSFVLQEGNLFTITNDDIAKPDTPTPSNPGSSNSNGSGSSHTSSVTATKTGDTANLALWLVLACIAALGAGGTFLWKKRQENQMK